MGLVSLICGLLIVGAHVGTLDAIRKNQEILTREAIGELLPGLQKQVIYGVLPSGELTQLRGLEDPGPRFFAGYDKAGVLLGVVIEASGRGYADVIRAMYAYSPQRESIIGLKVIELKETPGLGDKIATDKSFLANFLGLAARLNGDRSGLEHPIQAVKHGSKKNAWEVDAISGATISSRAVGRMLDKSARELLPLVVRHRQRIERGE
ncbi:MAG: FMN-binding protein [Bryobacteraceae bacterium]